MNSAYGENEYYNFLNNNRHEKGRISVCNYNSMNGAVGGKHNIRDHHRLYNILSTQVLKYGTYKFPTHYLSQNLPREKAFKLIIDIDGEFGDNDGEKMASDVFEKYKCYYHIRNDFIFKDVMWEEDRNSKKRHKGRLYFHNLLIHHNVYIKLVLFLKLKYPKIDKITSIRMINAYKPKKGEDGIIRPDFNSGKYLGKDDHPCVCGGKGDASKCFHCDVKAKIGNIEKTNDDISHIKTMCKYKRYSIFQDGTYDLFERCELINPSDLNPDIKDANTKVEINSESVEWLEELVEKLDINRSVNYTQWFTVLVLLKKYGADSSLAHTFSSKCKEKYTYSEVENVWNGVGNLFPYTEAVLFWLKDDIGATEFKKFVKKYNIKIIPRRDPSRKLKEVKDDEVSNTIEIDTSRISDSLDYIEIFKITNTIGLISNMGTGKTYALKELLKQGKTILIISFRKTLDRKYYDDFCQEGFQLYSDINGKLMCDKLIVQIDSICRVERTYDIVILDEARYDLGHMFDFSKNKSDVFYTLDSFIKYTPKVLVMDAFLTSEIVKYVKKVRGDFPVYKNKFKRFSDVKCKVHYKQGDFKFEIFEALKKGKKIVIPCNSAKFIKRIMALIKDRFPKLKILSLIRGDEIVSTKEWGNYDVLAYSPVITAGVSFDEVHFDCSFCYFTNTSSSAELSCQQMFRVRDLKDKKIHLFCKEIPMGYFPVTTEGVREYLRLSDDCSKRGIRKEHNTWKLPDNDYCNLYIDNLVSKNQSNVFYLERMNFFLKSQGVKVKWYKKKEKSEIRKEKFIEELKIKEKEIKEEIKSEDVKKVINSRLISESEYNAKIGKELNLNDRLEIEKYLFCNTFNIKDISEECYNDLSKKKEGYKNLKVFKQSNYDEIIADYQEEKALIRSNLDDIDRLHDSNHWTRMMIVSELLKVLGFKNPFDKKKRVIDYDKVRDYLRENKNDIYGSFSIKIGKMRDDGEVIKTVNRMIDRVIGLKIKGDINNGRKKEKLFMISGIELYGKHSVII